MIVTDKKNYYVDGSTVMAPEVHIEEKSQKKKEKKVFRKKIPNNSRKKLSIIGKILTVFIVGTIIIGRYSKIYNMQKQLNNINNSIVKLNKENENLKVELLKLNNIKSVEDIAIGKLKMSVPTKENMIYCDMSKEIFKLNKNANEEKNKNKGIIANFLSKLY
ncbi:cell division protein FtsL [Clostridium cochlearium]|uniref:Cell division protein FtsL n=1 Tax=Clostridium cochlearium TaxID=1494 RepID=A0A240AAF3_CLOCO|nr:cell division protein FtsL [Clostridium cochlearium]MBV1817840.1 cell division protein FtsL [Bacteroidales bacterium MSK.15.36]MCG4570678.1 cell division protein FtsL [Clostridium cochlearium]MDU1442837.1 cell division protein FtsL [Clostridium cochlearium]NMA58527.1 cell division protein FtsL [Clostridium cochlearium]NOH16345.1 cell division protein FtsL [Clostridium cochlearium]